MLLGLVLAATALFMLLRPGDPPAPPGPGPHSEPNNNLEALAASSTAPPPEGGENTLTVAPDHPDDQTYDRDRLFGDWDQVGPGCDTRDLVLARDLANEHTRGCDVLAGTLTDPYRGDTTTGPSTRWDIDHIYPPGLAWQTGARAWSQPRRHAFYVDPANLVTVNASDNRAKQDQGPEEWLPDTGRCAYAHAFERIAARWDLTVTAARQGALAAACRP